MKKILITGGAGYIGTVLTNRLLERGYDPKIVDTFWYGNCLPKDVEVKEKNILSLKQEEVEPFDVVIFLGGVSNDPMAEYKPSINFSENMASPSYLAYITRKAAIKTKTQKRFIYASTCSVYGYTSNNLMSESDPIPPPHTMRHLPSGAYTGRSILLPLFPASPSVPAPCRLPPASGRLSPPWPAWPLVPPACWSPLLEPPCARMRHRLHLRAEAAQRKHRRRRL